MSPASSRRISVVVLRIGIDVMATSETTGMIASTCLAVLFVPTFFVVIQRFENWLAARSGKKVGAQKVPEAGTAGH